MKDKPDKTHGKRFARHGEHGSHHMHGHRHKHGRRHKLGRFFAHGDLRFLILKLIADKSRHGYELIKAIEELVAGAYSPSPGVIYPTLTLLEELGWIRAIASEGNKRLYEITSDGSLALKANKAIVEAIFARMAEVSEAQADDVAHGKKSAGDTAMTPRLRVALDDLTRAIEQQLSAGPLTNEQVGTIVAALAGAASEIERV